MTKEIRLTPAQKEALNIRRHVFVEAGAGSGKTTILVNRYVDILMSDRALTPKHILALTFTEKAAQEMLERIQEKLQQPGKDHVEEAFRFQLLETLHQAHISTIHGFCLWVLRRYPIEAHIDPQLTMISETTAYIRQRDAVKSTLSALSADKHEGLKLLWSQYTLSHIESMIMSCFRHSEWMMAWREWRQQGLDPHVAIQEIVPHFLDCDASTKLATSEAYRLTEALGHCFDHCYAEYQKSKALHGECDFPDLIYKTHHLLTSNKRVLEELQQELPYIMIDEFQDTDPLQWDIIQLLVQDPTINLFVVGDTKQSIYGFRGADPDLYVNVREEFDARPDAQLVGLYDNFRSQPGVIHWVNQAFSAVFSNSKVPYHDLVSHRDQHASKVHVVSLTKGEGSEHDVLTEWIQDTLADHPNLQLHDIAILGRRKQGLLQVQDHLQQVGIPCVVHAAETSGYHDDIVDLYNWIQFFENPHHNMACAAILKSPCFGVTDTTFMILSTYKQQSFFESLCGISESFTHESWIAQGGTVSDWELCQSAAETLPQALLALKSQSVSQVIETLYNQQGVWALLSQMPHHDRRIARLKRVLAELSQVAMGDFGSIHACKQAMESILERGGSETPDIDCIEGAVQCLSIHASKGLEFPVVVVIDCGKSFNFARSDDLVFSRDKGPGISYSVHNGEGRNEIRRHILAQLYDRIIEEEKRLLYVACTRAKDHLLCCGTRSKPFDADKKPESYLDFLQGAGVSVETRDGGGAPVVTALAAAQTTESRQWTLRPFTCDEPAIQCSVTDIVTYLRCPKQYLRMKRDAYSLETTPHDTASSLAARKGELVHRGIQRLHTSLGVSVETHIEAMMRYEKGSSAEKKALGTTLKEHLSNYQSSELYRRIQQAKTHYHEQAFVIHSHGLHIEGRLDALFQDEHGHWVLVDYKTDHLGPLEIQVRVDTYKTQLTLYGLALKQSGVCEGLPWTAALCFTQRAETITVPVSEQDITTMEQSLATLYDEWQQGVYANKDRSACDQCPWFKRDAMCPDKPVVTVQNQGIVLECSGYEHRTSTP